MSNEKKETVDDIVAEMRKRRDCKDWTKPCDVVSDLADRIEKAHFRECECLREERNYAGIRARADVLSRLRQQGRLTSDTEL